MRLTEIDRLIAWLASLETAAQAHVHWLHDLHGILLFRRPLDPGLLSPDSYRSCAFGRWYRTVGKTVEARGPAFAELGPAHEEMHRAAADLLALARDRGGEVPEESYDTFMECFVRVNGLIRQVQGEAWSYISMKDPLTGFLNRRAMETFIRREGAEAAFGGAVAICDLDRFKSVNDTWGHQAGDEVLRQTARCIREQMRREDVVYRYGGEEFLLILRSAAIPAATAICERVRTAVRSLEVDIGQPTRIRVTASLGLALVPPFGDLQEAIARADAALLQAKAEGRDRVVVASEVPSPVPAPA